MSSTRIAFLTGIFILVGFVTGITLNTFIEADAGMDRRIKEAQDNQDKHLGEKVVIGKDTLVVVDTDFWCKYVLSNGQKLSGSYFDKK